MSDIIRKVDYYYIETADKAGEGAKILAALRNEGVNLLGLTGFPKGKRAQVDFIPDNSPAFEAAAKKIGLKLKKKKIGFLIQGDDRRGAMVELMEKLAAVKINVTAVDAVTAGAGRWGALLWVKPKDVAKAAQALGAF